MLFTVNTEVCTRCGLCVADCPTGLLVMTDDGPKTGKGGCISCGHCVAVCPTLALDSDLTPRAEQVDITNETKFTPEQAELFLRSRRSIRNYQNKPVPAELIRKVLNVARMAPTATNTQGISYIVILGWRPPACPLRILWPRPPSASARPRLLDWAANMEL